MKAKNDSKEDEVMEMFSTCKLLEDLMRRDALTPNLMMKKSGMPAHCIVAMLEGRLDISIETASLFERYFNWSAIELAIHQLRDRMGRLKARLQISRHDAEFLTKGNEALKLLAQIEKRLDDRPGPKQQ